MRASHDCYRRVDRNHADTHQSAVPRPALRHRCHPRYTCRLFRLAVIRVPPRMDKTYQPHAIETALYQNWEANNYFAPQGSGEPYTIMIPPPNVTGSLHMGHGFNNSIMDALIRFRRMQGRNTLWQPGTDHAGIATQMVVERQLAAEGIGRHDLGREKFLEKVWEWKEQSGGTITRQIRRLGSSVDWSRERFTMDDGLSESVKEAFVRLHKDGLIYRGKRLVNWDTKFHTAISDLEVESHDEKGSLWNLRYPLADGNKTADGKDYLIVATTRPETVLGDSAVAVHPEDERYKALIGTFVELPLVGRRIPIIADDYCDPEFGTGCVKITPAYDFNDYEVGKRHNLPLLNIFDKNAAVLAQVQAFNVDGSVNSEIDCSLPAEYAGLDRFEARKQIVAAFEAAGLLEGIDPHALKVPKGDRSGTIIEPWLTDQWYVSTKSLAEPAIAAVEDGRIQFVPKQYENMYFSWMRDIQDWCISRQLWWGHRIPAWYDEAGQVYVGRDEAEVRAKHNLAKKIPKQPRAEFPDGIAAYGTDALRFTNLALASTGRDVKFDMGRVEGYRNFCNKLWNAANFVVENIEGQDTGVGAEPIELSSVDRWIISALQRTEAEVTRQLDAFRFDLAAQALYEFIWDEYCAWYLELVKPVFWDETTSAERLRGTRRTLVRVLEVILRLAHPFMPFITEEIWQRIKGQAGASGDTIMLQDWPVANESRIDAAAEGDIEWVKQLMLGVRQIRGEMKISMAKRIDIIVANASSEDLRRLNDNAPLLNKLAKLESVRVLAAGEEAPMSATTLVGEMEVLVPMAGLIDKDAELARLDKEIQRLDGEVGRVGGKLANQGFVAKAPAEVLDKERAKLAEAEQALGKLKEQRERIASL